MTHRYMFKNDYSEGAHPKVLEYLQKTNFEQQEGYGLDEYSEQARDLLRQILKMPYVDIHFFTGGTQANLTFIGSALRPHEAVIAPYTAHINVHEAGAIEATGHKIFQLDVRDGKITAAQVEKAVEYHQDEHFVKPKMVFISNATELGTVYTKQELIDLYRTCKRYNLYLYIDGARLANALVAENNDLTLAELAQYTDAFYLGGTKNGALLGEALVITNPNLSEDFRYHLKQRGALLAKGRVVGLQFLALLEDSLYLQLARHANAMAQKMRKAIESKGYGFLSTSFTNQIFPILPMPVIERLYEKFDFYIWEKLDERNAVIRLVTSWATPETVVDEFIEYFNQIA